MNLSRYDGVTWQEGRRDCWWLVRDFYFHEYQISLPRICINSGNPLAVRRELKRNPARNLFSCLTVPVHGCVVELTRANRADHVGVYLVLDGECFVLHCEPVAGVCVTPLDELLMDYSLVGYYEYVGKRSPI